MVLLPQPLSPTMPIISFSRIVKFRWFRIIVSRGLYLKLTSLNSIAPLLEAGRIAFVSTISSLWSITSKKYAADMRDFASASMDVNALPMPTNDCNTAKLMTVASPPTRQLPSPSNQQLLTLSQMD